MPKPEYRFHGRTPPTPGSKNPVRAQITSTGTDDTGTAVLRLYDPIDSWGGDWGVSAKEFTAALDEIPDATQITLHINSPGGEVYEAVAILNALRNHPASVTAVVDGIAASAASFIAAGADQVVMGQNTQLMIHDAWGICIGAAVDMRSTGDLLDKLSDNIASIYAAKSGTDTAVWRAAMLAETWYSADEAVAAGLADRVEGEPPATEALNRFDLSRFKHSSRADAPPPPIPAAAAGRSPDGLRRRHNHLARKHGFQPAS